MNVHKNARTTPRVRAELVRLVLDEGQERQEAATRFNISRWTVSKWVERYQAAAEAGLQDRSSRPHHSPRQTPAALQLGVKVLRRHQRWTCQQIAQALELSRATVARIVKRAGWSRLGRLEAPVLARRYEHPEPGDLLHLDTKKLGRIERLGHRVTGDRRGQQRGAGWECVHVAVDDASRVAYVEVLPDERGETVGAFLQRAVAWFRQRHVRVRRVLTDNGSGYVSHSFRAVCRLLAVDHKRTRPYTPRTNGKAERFIQTLLREWAYARPYYTSAERTGRLPRWLEHYNCARPHTSLGRRPPVSRLAHGDNLMRLHS
jgi:transposase InsO family protein